MNRRGILILVALMCGLVILKLATSRREPIADGKPISYWLENLGDFDSDEPNAAAMALQKIGTNALPWMLREIRREKSKTKQWLEDQLEKQSLIKFKFENQDEHRGHAEIAFEILGPTAAPAIPDLMQLLEAVEVNSEVEEALAYIGAASVPRLIGALTNADTYLRENAADTLGRMGPDADSAVPPLLQCLHDPSADVRVSAAQALGGIRRVPEQAVPALVAALQDSERNVRFHAVYALGCFEDEAEIAVGPLLRLVSDREADVREQAASTLGQIARNSEEVVPILLSNLTNADASLRATIIWSLDSFPDKADDIVPVLMKEAENASPRASSAAFSSLGKLRSKPEDVVPFLVSRLEDPVPYVRFDAAIALGEFRDTSEQTILALTRLQGDKTMVFRGSCMGSVPVGDAARIALRAIQSDQTSPSR